MPSKKVLIIIGTVLVILLVISAVLYRNLKSEKNIVEKQAQNLLDKNGEFNAQSTEAQISDLKQSLLYLAREVGTIKTGDSDNLETASSNLESYSRVASPALSGNYNASADLIIRIKSLEDRLAVLERRAGVSSSPAPSSSPGAATSNLKVQYIPLGIDTTTNDKVGLALDTYDISLDPADFPNYTSISLEVVMKMSEAVGELSVNLYNYTDGVALSNSGITTSSTKYSSYSSPGFRLATGRKTYRLWVKSSEGYTVYIQSARLKVSY